MKRLRDRDYLNARIEQCRQSAANATLPDIRALHLQFAKMYEQELQRFSEETADRANVRPAVSDGLPQSTSAQAKLGEEGAVLPTNSDQHRIA